MNDYLRKEDRQKIIDCFGKSYYEKLVEHLNIYSSRWKLQDVDFIPSYSMNCVFKCYSEYYGNAVLKIGGSKRAVTAEYHTLREYDGWRLCKVYDADISNGVILEEEIQPGRSLFHGTSRDQRISIFSSLFKDMHIPPQNPGHYPTYKDWVIRSINYISRREDCTDLFPHIEKAQELFSSITEKYARNMLLHGDLHHENILSNHAGEYIIIDPKGVTGDPVFDISRFILNEFNDTFSIDLYLEIEAFISALAKSLHIPCSILKICLYIETTVWLCDELQQGVPIHECSYLIGNILHAKSMLSN
ncbi:MULTISPECIES: aminoglycoside phosphotransferase family protein [Paenibacillus]|uniref:Aminoglycoside/hydroxyurea antibiotic resistance kinase n=2 Tax=Paenibacillus lactis TaxID=228574 RepID=G4H9J7_9BACL|nr:aminoglycoside phosphotransferase family protein [Paenibacillus lactis]EHB68532.1 aminoglycoside/hydroxyurea antibiotic resistance kinase [Paenibacillus lactis 154]MBP1893437.1 streptomycin 6-kinase [Paenibacillus lactis]GIO91058.1 hypothetical protein J31TS3_22850 [Paenibacillus lactis]